MPPERGVRRLRSVATLLAVATLPACASSPITADRIERAVESTFANLVHEQISRLDLPSSPPASFEVMASCRKAPTDASAGAGDWVCRIRWLGPERQMLHDTFDLAVTTDGCYTATAEGNNLGGPLLKRRDGIAIRNLLYVFEGCFDPS